MCGQGSTLVKLKELMVKKGFLGQISGTIIQKYKIKVKLSPFQGSMLAGSVLCMWKDREGLVHQILKQAISGRYLIVPTTNPIITTRFIWNVMSRCCCCVYTSHLSFLRKGEFWLLWYFEDSLAKGGNCNICTNWSVSVLCTGLVWTVMVAWIFTRM